MRPHVVTVTILSWDQVLHEGHRRLAGDYAEEADPMLTFLE
jgi:hypothetical protein